MNTHEPGSTHPLSRRGFLGGVLGGATAMLSVSAQAGIAPSAWAPEIQDGAIPGQRLLLEDYVNRLCYNENPLGPSPAAKAAMREEIDLGHRYGDWYAETLRGELAALHGVITQQTIAGCGATEMLRLCALAFVNPSGNVVCPYPSYSQFPSDSGFLGAEVRYSYLDAAHRVDLNDILAQIDSGTSAVCLTNPNNPTATVLAASDIAAFVDALPPQVTVIIDEAYHEYVEDPDYESAVNLVLQGKPVVVLRTFSKVFGLAGVRAGYAVGRIDLISMMTSRHIYATVSRLAQAGARAALQDAQHVADTTALNAQAKAYCFAAFDAMGLDYIPSEASFFMLDVGQPASGVSSELAARGIRVRTGWGMPQHLRISTGTMEEMETLITALQEILGLSAAPGTQGPWVMDLHGSFPNPFSGQARISLSLAGAGPVRVRIFDIHGRAVRELLNTAMSAGMHEVLWDGRDQNGNRAASGSYFCRLESEDGARTRRMILAR